MQIIDKIIVTKAISMVHCVKLETILMLLLLTISNATQLQSVGFVYLLFLFKKKSRGIRV